MRPSAALCLAFSLGIVAVACGRDSQPPTAPGGGNPPAAKLEILSVPASLLVRDSVLLTAGLRNADGTVGQPPPDLQWTSSDETVIGLQPGSGSAERVVTALRRGTVALTVTAGNTSTSVILAVKARVSILPDAATPCEFPLTVCVAIGETTSLRAVFVDVNGERLAESATSTVAWSSSAPDVARVTSAPVSHLTGLRVGRVTITASTADGAGTLDVIVTDVNQSGTAKVRFAHVDHSRGTLTFVPSQGARVTLAFGESTDVVIAAGTFSVQVDGAGLPDSRSWLIRDGDRLEIFATNSGVTGWWTNRASIPADSGLIRFVQASGTYPLVVFLGAPGAMPAESPLVECYFDPLGITQYVPVRVGEFDVLAGGKGLFLSPGSAIDVVRRRISVAPGRAVTYAITGDSPETMRLLAFPEL
jgi:hypothetical protein